MAKIILVATGKGPEGLYHTTYEYKGNTIEIENGEIKVDGNFEGIFYGETTIILIEGKISVVNDGYLLIEDIEIDKTTTQKIFNYIKGKWKEITLEEVTFNLGIISGKFNIGKEK